MKLFLVFVALMASAAAYDDLEMLDEQELERVMLNETLAPETMGLILNSQAKKCVKNILKQMPCGWPEYGIPAIAPYTAENLKLELANDIAQALLELFRFRFDGLDRMVIEYLKVSYTFNKKVKFHFNFKELRASAFTLDSDILLNLKKLGLEIHYVGKGPFVFSLNNLSLEGSFKYKAGIIGSSKIYKFNVVITLGSVTSHIGGILGNGRANDLLNKQIEILIPALINGYQKEISSLIEQNFVPRVNAQLKGKKIWHLFSLLGSSNHKCVPTPAPWLLETQDNEYLDFVKTN